MAIVQADVQVEKISLAVELTSIPDGRYLIKNRAADIYWCTDLSGNIYTTLGEPKTVHFQVNEPFSKLF